MAEHTLYQVDAFAERLFTGNPAAVMILDAFPPDETMQALAQENNLAETAFAVPTADGFDLRWFTPAAEVPFCGHATLATAHVLFAEEGYAKDAIAFRTRAVGTLTVARAGAGYALDGPATPIRPIQTPEQLAEGLGTRPEAVFAGQYLMAVLPDEASVRALTPNMLTLAEVRAPGGGGLDASCVCVTAPGTRHDFVSRFFGPTVGITEDPVTGSAHCMMAPYWAARLGRSELSAFQASPRGGEVGCTVKGDRVRLEGGCITYLKGRVRLG